MDGKNININILLQLKELFEFQGWEIDNDNCSLFNRYVCTLSKMTLEQQRLILDLSHRFYSCPITSYVDNLIPPLLRLREKFINEFLFITVAIPRNEQCEAKSAYTVLYLFKGASLKRSVQLDNYSVVMPFKDPKSFRASIQNKSNYKIVLVDDFIGSGQTVATAAKEIMDEFQIAPEKIIALSLVAMQDGINYLESNGIEVFCNRVQTKGISDYYSNTEQVNAKRIMTDIEDTIKVKGEFRFGFNGSESLVCMERCPNNTFPIYWLKKMSPYER